MPQAAEATEATLFEAAGKSDQAAEINMAGSRLSNAAEPPKASLKPAKVRQLLARTSPSNNSFILLLAAINLHVLGCLATVASKPASKATAIPRNHGSQKNNQDEHKSGEVRAGEVSIIGCACAAGMLREALPRRVGPRALNAHRASVTALNVPVVRRARVQLDKAHHRTLQRSMPRLQQIGETRDVGARKTTDVYGKLVELCAYAFQRTNQAPRRRCRGAPCCPGASLPMRAALYGWPTNRIDVCD
jgi:hypothetical protein